MRKVGEFHVSRVAGASLLAMAIATGFSAPAMAQTSPEQDSIAQSGNDLEADAGDAIIVTGFRSSLEKAIDLKREQAEATDSILAEDIGKFPDLNLSESIQRIPGVAVARDGGEGRSISVRGLGPQFTRVRINGMEALATSGGADSSGGTNRGRGFDFNVFASDLFNAITVRKSAEATVEEGSLGATVDLRTAQPFDYDEFTMVASAQGGYNDLAKTFNPRGAFLISDTTSDGTFGALLSVAYTKRKLTDEGFGTVRWAKGSSFSPGFGSVLGADCTDTPDSCAEANDALHPRFPRYEMFKTDQERLGATLSLQWRPSDATEISLNGLYADLKGTREERYLEAPGLSAAGVCTDANRPTTCGIADIDITDMQIDNGVMTKGTFDDVDLRSENRLDRLKTKFRQVTLDAKHELSDMLTLNLLGGYSYSDFSDPVQNTVSFDQYNVDGFSYDFTHSRHPVFNFGDRVGDPSQWSLYQLRLRAESSRNTFATGQGSLAWEVNDEFTLMAGANYRRYKFRTSELRRSNGTPSNIESSIPPEVALIPLTDYGQMLNYGGTSWFSPDIYTATDVLSLRDQEIYGGAFHLGPEPSLGNNQGVTEEDKGAFFQADFHHDFGALLIRGNVGLRYVNTKQSARGYTFIGDELTPLTMDRSYDDWLPSANLVIEPTEQLLVRLSAARVMARPDLTSLPPGASVTVSGSSRSVSVGNPLLNPYRATALDASVEWYFQPGALLSVAVFQKDIDSFVQTLTNNGTFTGNPFGLPDSAAIAACGSAPNCSPDLNNWQFSAPQNTGGGRLRGFEINYQQPLSFLPGFLSNTGLLLNYTDVSSKVNYLDSSGEIVATENLTGLSRRSANATLYYEDSKFGARVSGAYRSRYLTLVPARETGTDVDGTNGTFNIDASLQYSLNEHVKFTLEGINLTDEYQDQFNDRRNLSLTYRRTGREFIVGVRYSY